MSYAEILVPLTGEIRDLIALKTAIAAARPFNAHITALFVHFDPKFALSYASMALSANAIIELERDTELLTRQAQARAKEVVLTVLAQEGLSLSEQAGPADKVVCSFKVVTGLFNDKVLEAALLSDLVVFGAINGGLEPDVWESCYETLIRAGKPVLLANQSPPHLTNKISIAWDESSAAAHAVSAALPLLKAAKEVDIVTVDGARQQIGTDRLRAYLALHGVSASSRTVPRGKYSVGLTLMEAAAQAKSDALVVGGYGHNYWREMLFGGVTDDIRRHPDLPVLVAH